MKHIFLLVLCTLSILVEAQNVSREAAANRSRKSSRHPRIIGGRATVTKEIPYHVYIEYFDRHLCGGNLISDRHVLTVATCVYQYRNASFDGLRVVVGKTLLSQKPAERIRVEHIYIHPDFVYGPQSHDGNLAIVELLEPIRRSARVKPIRLPESNDEFLAVGKRLSISGFGSPHPDSIVPSEQLLKLTVKIIDPRICQSQWSDWDFTVDSSLICAQAKSGGLCFGDIGTGLVDKNNKKDPVLIGIGLATPSNTCVSSKADIYTNVSHYLRWIKYILSLLESLESLV